MRYREYLKELKEKKENVYIFINSSKMLNLYLIFTKKEFTIDVEVTMINELM